MQFAKQADLDALHAEFHAVMENVQALLSDLDRHAEVLELAVIKVAQDNEYLSNLMVEVGLLTNDDDMDDPRLAREEIEDEDEDEAHSHIAVDPDNPAHEVDLDEYLDTFRASDDGMPEDDAEEREARAAAARARRAAAVEAQGLRELAEDANESDPSELDTDPNSIRDIPEEGILVAPAKDEPEMFNE